MKAESRRKFIQRIGLGSGAALLTGIGGQLAVQAQAPAKVDRCFFATVHGMAWWPTLIRPTNVQSTTEWEFQSTLDPLTKYKDRVILLERLFNPHGAGLHGNYGSGFTVVPPPDNNERAMGGISIDRRIAKDLSADTPFSSVNIGHSLGGNRIDVSNLSAEGRNAPFPAMTVPEDIIENVFGAQSGQTEAAVRRAALKQSLLDGMGEDVERAQTRLAGPERATMDQYLTSVRDLELQAQQLQAVECTAPTWDGPRIRPTERITAINPQQTAFYYNAAKTALACGLTRVVTLYHEGVGDEPLQPKYNFQPVNVSNSLHGGVSHDLNGLNNQSDDGWNESGRRGSVNAKRRVYTWRAQQLADLFDEFHELPFAGSTLGERSLILWTNAGGGLHHRGSNDIPVLLLGSPDGALNGGQYIKYGNRMRCMSDVFQTAAHAVGVPLDGFGDAENNKGVLPGLLA